MEKPPQPPLGGLDPAAFLKQGIADDTYGGPAAFLPPAIGETPGFSERFTREAKALAKLNHPGVAKLSSFVVPPSGGLHVDEDRLKAELPTISRQPGSSGVGTSVSPSKWRAGNGWFAFIENENHAWAYDGDDKLMLVEVAPENSTLYETETIPRTVPEAIQPLISQSTLGRIGAKIRNAPDSGKTEAGGPEIAVLAEMWIAGIDAGNYGQSWQDSAKFFQTAITEAGWSDALAKPLGETKSRKVLNVTNAASLPGAPDGEYVVMQFETSFAAKEKAVETVTFTKESDGSWKACSYFIK